MDWSRRRLLQAAPLILKGRRPMAAQGVAAGDVTATRALIWSRADGPSRMMVRSSLVLRIRKHFGRSSEDMTSRSPRSG